MNVGGDVNKVWEINALKKKPKAEEARKILEAIAKQVQPIMRKHNWRVKVLSEFCPTNPRLLGVNVNKGVNIKLRLRRPNIDDVFLPYDEVLDTMLHELCHNAHGPHNTSFYKLWDDLRKECEDLMSKGISGTGEGFDLPGKRLGGLFPKPPISSLRKTALSAAEKRANLSNLLPSGPKRLGGDTSLMSALTPTQAASMAAERRFRDNIWCASETCDPIEEDETSHQKPADTEIPKEVPRKRTFSSDKIEESNIIDLTDCDSISGPTSQKKVCYKGSSSNIHQEVVELDDDFSTSEKSSMWECLNCTLLNPPLAPICELCSTHRPKKVESKNRTWSCKFCTLENDVKLEKCDACGDWRYSHGPPISTSIRLDT